MRRLGGAVLAALFSLAAPAAAQDAHQHHAAAGSAAIVADAKATVAAPAFSPAPGTLAAPNNKVTLTTATAGATIYYTTNGTSPSRKTSPVYSGPIAITATTTLKAFAYKKGMTASAVTSGLYTFSNAPPPPPPSEVGGTLFVGTLTPQGSATSTGSGSATLTLTQDKRAAFLRFNYSSLTGPITSQHIHGATAPSSSTSTPRRRRPTAPHLEHQAVGTYSVAAILAARTAASATSTSHRPYPAGEIRVSGGLSSGSQTFTPPPAPPALPGGAPTADDAARLLLQATYGARPGDVEAVQQKGLRPWLDEQMATPPASHLAKYDELEAQLGPDQQPNPGLVVESFVQQAVEGGDQLRQRVVFALSELFVISARDADVRNFPKGWAPISTCSASTPSATSASCRASLSPPAWVYLDMAGSTRASRAGAQPQRELSARDLQLFSIASTSCTRARCAWTQQPADSHLRPGGGQGLRPRLHRLDLRRPDPGQPAALLPPAAQLPHPDGAVGLLPRQRREGAARRRHPARRPGRLGRPRAVARRHLRAPQRRALRLPLADPAAGDQQSQPGLRLPLRPGVRQQRHRRARRHGDGGARHPCSTTRRAPPASRRGRSRAPARAGGAAARPGAHRRRHAAQRPLRILHQSAGEAAQRRPVPLNAPTVFNFFEPVFALPGRSPSGAVSRSSSRQRTTVVTAANSPSRCSATPQRPLRFASRRSTAAGRRDAALLDKVDLLSSARHDRRDRAILAAGWPTPTSPNLTRPARADAVWLASLTPESVVQK